MLPCGLVLCYTLMKFTRRNSIYPLSERFTCPVNNVHQCLCIGQFIDCVSLPHANNDNFIIDRSYFMSRCNLSS